MAHRKFDGLPNLKMGGSFHGKLLNFQRVNPHEIPIFSYGFSYEIPIFPWFSHSFLQLPFLCLLGRRPQMSISGPSLDPLQSPLEGVGFVQWEIHGKISAKANALPSGNLT